jgi:hypothetical protein
VSIEDYDLPLSMFDPERVRNLIALGIERHPERERVDRFLRAGAGFFAKHDNGELQFALMFTDDAPGYAAMRAEVWGGKPEPIQDADRNEILNLIRVPASVVGQPPQG